MIEFNGRNISVGYIKQLLHSFNLPLCRVFESAEDCVNFFESPQTPHFDNRLVVIIKNFIGKDPYFVSVDDGLNLKAIEKYRYDHFYPNLTKTMKLENDLYDSSTHDYLGDYLRFIRDFFGINLMGMYNCYDGTTEIIGDYKFIIVPVKYGEQYSIFSTANSIEYTITNETNDTDLNRLTDTNAELVTASRIGNSACMLTKTDTGEAKLIETGKPTLHDIELDDGTTKHSPLTDVFVERNLRLVIRLNADDDIPFVILEGDHRRYKDYFLNLQVNYEREVDGEFEGEDGKGAESRTNPYAYEDEYAEIFSDNINDSYYQLIEKMKTSNDSYPIADRLIEFLSGNVITQEDPLSRNIIDAKRKLGYRYLDYTDTQMKRIDSSYTIMDRFKMLDALSANSYYKADEYDLTGFVDKDVEGVLNDTRYPKED